MTPPTSIHAVQAVFASLDLPLCDDQQAVEQASDRQRDTRNRELNSTKGTIAVRAQAWFDDVDTLLNRRGPLLEAAYEHFAGLAEACLAIAAPSERKRLGRRARKSLAPLAVDWCGARPDLADAWVKRFAEQRKLGPQQADDEPNARARPAARATAGARPTNRRGASQRPGAQGGASPGASRPKRQAPSDRSHAGRAETRSATRSGQGGRPAQGGTEGPGQRLSRSRLMLAVLAAVVLTACLGAASLGDWWSPAAEASTTQQAVAEGTTPDDTGTPPEATDGDVAATAAAPSEDDDPEPEPWRLGVHAAPTRAYAGQALVLRLDCDATPGDEPLELFLRGLSLRGFDFDAQPPALRLTVDALPPGENEGRASWSLRLRDVDGNPSTWLKGDCLVERAD